jgi:hypothetical protein
MAMGWGSVGGRRRPQVAPAVVISAVAAVARHPTLWSTALRQWRRLTPPRWWRRRPFLPLPDAHYVRFRLLTHYGAAGPADPADVVRYLDWCRQMRPRGG